MFICSVSGTLLRVAALPLPKSQISLSGFLLLEFSDLKQKQHHYKWLHVVHFFVHEWLFSKQNENIFVQSPNNVKDKNISLFGVLTLLMVMFKFLIKARRKVTTSKLFYILGFNKVRRKEKQGTVCMSQTKPGECDSCSPSLLAARLVKLHAVWGTWKRAVSCLRGMCIEAPWDEVPGSGCLNLQQQVWGWWREAWLPALWYVAKKWK